MATTTTRQKVIELTKQGRTPREIALRLGLSTQAVYQQLDRIKRGSRELTPAPKS